MQGSRNFARQGESVEFLKDADDMGFEDFMLKPTHINEIWKNSKVKVAMFNFM